MRFRLINIASTAGKNPLCTSPHLAYNHSARGVTAPTSWVDGPPCALPRTRGLAFFMTDLRRDRAHPCRWMESLSTRGAGRAAFDEVLRQPEPRPESGPDRIAKERAGSKSGGRGKKSGIASLPPRRQPIAPLLRKQDMLRKQDKHGTRRCQQGEREGLSQRPNH